MALTTEHVSIDTLTPDPQNARKHDKKNLDAIAASLTQFGQRRPLVVHGDTVIAGNGTLAAARQIGWTDISITRVPADWTTEQAKAYAIADNRTAELATWDRPILAEIMLELEDAGFTALDLGFEPIIDDKDDNDLPDLGDVATRFEVVVECQTEMEQESVLLRLSSEGLKVRAIVI